jgi:regulator of ribonuclease E activity RraA/HMG-CHA aldolase family protein
MREDLAEQFGTLATTAVSDALDRLGIAGQAAGIKPLDRSFRMAGRAFTIRYQPVDVNGGTVGDYIDDVPPGAVVALDNAGRPRHGLTLPGRRQLATPRAISCTSRSRAGRPRPTSCRAGAVAGSLNTSFQAAASSSA